MKMKMKNGKTIFALLITPLVIASFIILRTPQVKAAVEKITSVFVTNWPELFKTREQNIDINGNIKVHEQGTVDVNVVNQGNSQLQPKKVVLFENYQLSNGNANIISETVNIDGYKKMGYFVSRTDGDYKLTAAWQFSLDGQKWFIKLPDQYMDLGPTNNRFIVIDIVAPFARALIDYTGGNLPFDVSAYFYLIP